MKPWLEVRRVLGVAPVVAGPLPGPVPLFAERYFLRRASAYGPPLSCITLYCQFGGARVRETDGQRTRMKTSPHQAALVPAGVETSWQYEGSVDYAAFYLPERGSPDCDRLRQAVHRVTHPLPFSNLLVNACARQVVDELQRGRQADRAFLEHLVAVMLERVTRIVASQDDVGVQAPGIQLFRLQSVIAHVRRQLATDLSVERLAEVASVSPAHFRRLFRAAMGVPPHRYVLQQRIERARELLTQGNWPMSRIAEDCGFCSQSHFTRAFAQEVGVTPTAFRGRAPRPRRQHA